MQKRINILDEKTINKIAAGEVIERPASVIKELVENAIDAKSTHITIEIKKSGKKYIRITDDGIGMDDRDLQVAFLSHTTSKIKNSEDLFNLETLGFRGEALASIAAISHIEVISRQKNQITGKRLIIHGGEIQENDEVGCPTGTTISVSNIFYNTPVRDKFLKSDNVEASQASDIIYKLALSNPHISMKYIKDNRVIIKTPGDGSLSNTVYSLYGKEFINSLFKIEYIGEDIKIRGLISKPSFTRGNRGYQYFFVNGRYIKSNFISSILEDNYSTLIPVNRFPIAILYIELDPKKIDVNVHPTKTEIRINDEEKLKNSINAAINQVINNEDLVPEVKMNKIPSNEEAEQVDFLDYVEEVTIPEAKKWDLYYEPRATIEVEAIQEPYDIFKGNSVDIPSVKGDRKGDLVSGSKKPIPKVKVIGTLFKTYILAEDTKDNTFYMIDQHAAHERVIYEKYKKQFDNQSITIQELLVPQVIEITHSEAEIIRENISLFREIGFKIDGFGQNSIIIRGVPLIFGKPDSKGLFLDILDDLKSNMKNSYNLRLEKIMKMACVSAVKAGNNLQDIEIDSLIEELWRADNPYTCPHGRPVVIKMTKYEIEKKFKRV